MECQHKTTTHRMSPAPPLRVTIIWLFMASNRLLISIAKQWEDLPPIFLPSPLPPLLQSGLLSALRTQVPWKVLFAKADVYCQTKVFKPCA